MANQLLVLTIKASMYNSDEQLTAAVTSAVSSKLLEKHPNDGYEILSLTGVPNVVQPADSFKVWVVYRTY